MNLKTCNVCRRIFDSLTGSSVCPNCYSGQDESFKKVRHYIRSNPNSTIFEVSEACDVELSQLRNWIREERIEYTKESSIGIDCERCGKMIRTGRYCDECKTEVYKKLNSVYKEQPNMDSIKKDDRRLDLSKDERMRFLNKKNK